MVGVNIELHSKFIVKYTILDCQTLSWKMWAEFVRSVTVLWFFLRSRKPFAPYHLNAVKQKQEILKTSYLWDLFPLRTHWFWTYSIYSLSTCKKSPNVIHNVSLRDFFFFYRIWEIGINLCSGRCLVFCSTRAGSDLHSRTALVPVEQL